MYAFEWDVASDAIVRSQECIGILDWMSDPVHDTGMQFRASLHPDDRQAYSAWETGLVTPEHPTYQTCYRVVRPGGSVIWLEESGRGHFDEQGRMVRWVGMVGDVTERKRAECMRTSGTLQQTKSYARRNAAMCSALARQRA